MANIAIVGCSQSKDLAPFNDANFEIWGVNNLYPFIPRATRWFEIHEITLVNGVYLRRGSPVFRGQPVVEYLKNLGEFAAKHNIPVYMQKKWDIVPTSVVYPLEEIVKTFGEYFTNTVSYELALAIYEKLKGTSNAEEIHVYGVDMAVDTEYHHQRPSCEYFLGIIRGLELGGMKIKHYIPDEADLLKTMYLYGFNEPHKNAWDKKRQMMAITMQQKRARLDGEIEQLKRAMQMKENQIQQYLGAEGALKESHKIWA